MIRHTYTLSEIEIRRAQTEKALQQMEQRIKAKTDRLLTPPPAENRRPRIRLSPVYDSAVSFPRPTYAPMRSYRASRRGRRRSPAHRHALCPA